MKNVGQTSPGQNDPGSFDHLDLSVVVHVNTSESHLYIAVNPPWQYFVYDGSNKKIGNKNQKV